MPLSVTDASLIPHLRKLPEAARAQALDEACAADPTLRSRLPDILAALAASNGHPPVSQAVDVLEAALAAAPDDTAGAQIGHYKLLQELGEGGFGTVWMADQQHPIRRRVALKIIKLGMDTREVIARFEAERQALALMDHPNIARVFDAGATDAGRPYFAMELVRGVPITRYCDENRLVPEARLRLFITVCQAVQHAHQKGVIHRDLKPSNILVTLHDGVPVPKVIDFGIAKATSAHLTDKTLFTQFHAFIGTPAYTSPEQMEMSGLDVDTRSDIYSLGVLLYELLTGRPPFDPDALAKSGLEAMRRTVREIDPPRPSARLGTLSDADRTSVALQRGTDSAKLSLLLRGDLDWIVMHCLEKDRMRRYETANGLAVDVQRHLASEPVSARPPSSTYRLRKFIRRHRLGFTAAAAVGVALIAGLIASSALLVRERSAHARAVTAEQAEGKLRQQAEVARASEEKSAIRTALDLANRNLADGRVADGLAYLVYAARKDTHNPALAPRIASVLTSYNFAIPRAAPLACGSRVLAVRFTQDGRSFHVGTQDGTFRVLDSETGALKRQFHLGREVILGGWEFARANDTVIGARFADNTFGVYDIAAGGLKMATVQLDPSIGLPASPRAVGLSPDGRWIYANAPQEFWLWSSATGALQLHLSFPENIGGCDFSPDGNSLALPVGNSVERWSLPGGTHATTPIRFRASAPSALPNRGPSALPTHAEVRFSPDGRRLAVVDYVSAQIFDVASGELVQTLPKFTDYLTPAMTAFPSNERLFVATQIQSGWWDLSNGRFSASPVAIPAEVSFDSAGRRLIARSMDGFFRVVEAGNPTLVAEPGWGQNAPYCAALSPDGTHALMGTADGMIYRFDLGRGAARPLVLPRTLTPFALPASFLPGSPARLLRLAPDHAEMIDVASGREIPGGFRYPEPIVDPTRIDTHPPIRRDLRFMVVRTQRGEWQSWELGLEGVQRAIPLQEAPNSAATLAFSPQADLVALSPSIGATRVWNLRTGAPTGPSFTHPSGVESFSPSFSPDAGRLAVGAIDGEALLFQISTARPVLRLRTSPLIRTFKVQFSHDGKRVATVNIGGEIRLWDAATGESISPLSHHVGSGNAIFSTDDRWFATSSPKTVQLLDGRSGAAVGRIIPAGGKSVNFSADGNRLATAERAGSAQVWAVPSGEAVTEPMWHRQRYSNLPEFSPDGRFLKTENIHFNLWAVPPPLPDGISPPEWLLDLATLCAGELVNDAGQLVPATESLAKLERLRQQIATLPADAPLAGWGRWVLDDRPERPIAPGFTITPAEADALSAKAAAAAASATTP